jgi:hypothetical protein
MAAARSAIPPAHPLFREITERAFTKHEAQALAATTGTAVPSAALKGALAAAVLAGWSEAVRAIVAQAKESGQQHVVYHVLAEAAKIGAVMPELKVEGMNYNVALACAAANGQLKSMQLLRSWGAGDVEWALSYAARADQVAAMELAKEWGASGFNNALAEAAEAGRLEAMQSLKVWGAKDYANAQRYATVGARAVLQSWETEDVA